MYRLTEATEQAVRQFLDGEGPKLQAKLLEYRETVSEFETPFACGIPLYLEILTSSS